MTYENVELLRTPGDSLALLGLLPVQEIDATSNWAPPAWVLPCLAGVEAVSEATANCKIEKLDSQFAIIAFEGRLTGAVQGAVTKITVSGKVAAVRWLHLRNGYQHPLKDAPLLGAALRGLKRKQGAARQAKATRQPRWTCCATYSAR